MLFVVALGLVEFLFAEDGLHPKHLFVEVDLHSKHPVVGVFVVFDLPAVFVEVLFAEDGLHPKHLVVEIVILFVVVLFLHRKHFVGVDQ